MSHQIHFPYTSVDKSSGHQMCIFFFFFKAKQSLFKKTCLMEQYFVPKTRNLLCDSYTIGRFFFPYLKNIFQVLEITDFFLRTCFGSVSFDAHKFSKNMMFSLFFVHGCLRSVEGCRQECMFVLQFPCGLCSHLKGRCENEKCNCCACGKS